MTLSRSKPMTRTGALGQSSFQRLAVSEAKPNKGPKLKKCAVRTCRTQFVPTRPFIRWCSDDCAHALAMEKISKQKAKENRQERAQDKIKHNGMKTYPQLIRDVQAAFNTVVRLRDQLAELPCISSGKTLDWSGNAVDAGHYRSRGSAPHLRFNFDNCHAQSKQDNRYGSGEAVAYRIGLINRIGLDRVEALESNNTPCKWSHEELRSMKQEFRKKTLALKKELAYKNNCI